MMQNCNHLRRLPLQGAPNTRDLGGCPCAGGASTKWGVFLRSASPAGLTPADVDMLLEYGLDTVVDLRSEQERLHGPSKLEGVAGIGYHTVPLLDHFNSSNFEGDLPGSMSGLYISLLDNNAEDFAKIFRIFLQAKGVSLFNCSAGKDRTGVVAMLLLGLAGAADADIEADYALTDIYMRGIFISQLKDAEGRGLDMPEYVFLSRPESMRRVLQHLRETYGDAQSYLLRAGLQQAELDALRRRFVQQGTQQ